MRATRRLKYEAWRERKEGGAAGAGGGGGGGKALKPELEPKPKLGDRGTETGAATVGAGAGVGELWWAPPFQRVDGGGGGSVGGGCLATCSLFSNLVVAPLAFVFPAASLSPRPPVPSCPSALLFEGAAVPVPVPVASAGLKVQSLSSFSLLSLSLSAFRASLAAKRRAQSAWRPVQNEGGGGCLAGDVAVA